MLPTIFLHTVCFTPAHNAKISSGLTAIVCTKKYHSHTAPPESEVRLRHLTVEEALPKLDQYLHDAFIAGLYQVRVIHGKGTGTLRQVAQKLLAEHPLVKSYRLGRYGEGGTGVTIVELADK